MAISEFRFNKKRKHYSYIHSRLGKKRKNILITTKPAIKKRNKIVSNKRLFHHPNKDKIGEFYVIPRNYLDDKESFGDKKYDWSWNRNDKRTIKRIKKRKF